ncbi:MAG TPA: FadR/GntR family transcriptional regulator [Bryobacteraceae bacterium]|jgi:GntR family transcriptional regulator, transcriptional repressor for pyruvate dehydrogenase complex|nr:FadR/GntR family transcriptional regulator [Bryobacteraceae bacterium]
MPRTPQRKLKAVSPLVRTTLTASAFEQLITYVVGGDWTVGDRIPPERELCQQLGIARTSLREALKAMELIGMLESRVGDGTFVCDRSEFLSRPLLWAFTGTDHHELRDIMEAREFIERDLAGLAAERGSDAEIEAIGVAVERMRESLTRGESIFDADSMFHLAIADAAHNEVLRNAVQLLRNLMRQWIVLKYLIPDVPNNVLKQHEAIFRAIRERSAQGARNAMWKHLEDTAYFVSQVVERGADHMKNGRKRRQ